MPDIWKVVIACRSYKMGGIWPPAVIQIYTSLVGVFLSIAFTPDGNRLVTSGARTIYAYTFVHDELVHLNAGLSGGLAMAIRSISSWFLKIKCPAQGTFDFVSSGGYPLNIGVPNRIRTGDVRSTVGSFAAKL